MTQTPVTPSGPRQPLMMVVVAVALGYVVDRLAGPAVWISAGGAVVGWLVWRRSHRQGKGRRAAWWLFASVTALAAAWHHDRWSWFSARDVGLAAPIERGAICLEGVVRSTPRLRRATGFNPLNAFPESDVTSWQCEVVQVRAGNTWRAATGLVALRVSGHVPGLGVGDRIRCVGQFARPRRAMNPGEFDLAEHRRGERTLCELWLEHPACVSIVEPAGRWQPRRWLDRLRRAGVETLEAQLSPDGGRMAQAMLLGERDQLDEETSDAFFRTGMIHVLCISGLHVGILSAGWLALLRWCGVRRGAALAGVALLAVGYATLIDAGPPAVRATILVVLACWSLQRGLSPAVFNALAAGGLMILIMQPAELFRAGPQLSFLSAGVLAWCGRWQAQRGVREPGDALIDEARPAWQRALFAVGRGVRDAFGITLLVWLAALPLVMWRFHLVSPVALVLTPVVAWPVAIGLLSGFGVLIAGGIAPWLAGPLGVICDGALRLVGGLVEAGARWSGGHAWTPGPAVWWVLGFYGLLVWAALEMRGSAATRRRWGLVAGWSSCMLLPWPGMKLDPEQLRVTFLSVGHGAAVVLELPDGRTWLYDCGRLGSSHLGAETISGFLWSRGVQRLDAVIISHADVDHFNAFPELTRRFEIGRLILSPTFDRVPSAATRQVQEASRSRSIERVDLAAGATVRLGDDLELSVLHPPSEGLGGSDNANSLVVRLDYQGRSVLLPGDLESPGLERLLAQPSTGVDVLLAPHHGSPRSDPPGCAAWSRAAWVIISGGRETAGSEVATTYSAHGARVMHTAREGAVTIELDRNGCRCYGFVTGSSSRQ